MRTLNQLARRASSLLPDELFSRLFFLYSVGYLPHIHEPRSFNEKLQWLKLRDRTPLRALVVDRIKVGDFVTQHAPECQLVRRLWVGQEMTQGAWQALPDSFVLKGAHGSGFVFLCRSKAQADFAAVYRKTQRWLARDYSRTLREWPYRDLRRLLIAEELLLDGDEKIPMDFKFFCFNGRVGFVQVDVDRFEHHTRCLYSRDFAPLDVSYVYSQGPNVPTPANFAQAISIAEKLSAPFDFVRVDLYLLDRAVFFGEMTCFPEGGFGRFTPRSFDFACGQDLRLAGRPV